MVCRQQLQKLRSLLGAAGWYRKFIADFATIASLTALTRKNAKYNWTEDQQKAFDQLTAEMATTPMLSRPEPGDDVSAIQTDASNTVLTEVINVTREFRPYIKSYKFKVITDHTSFHNLKTLNEMFGPMGT